MSVKQGDGVCLILNVVNATISNLVVTAPASFLLSSLPPQYHPGQQGASVVYASGVTYNGPARFRFVFGANQTGSYSLTATWNNVTVAEVTVSVQ